MSTPNDTLNPSQPPATEPQKQSLLGEQLSQETNTDWLNQISEEYRSNESIKSYKSLDDLAKSHLHLSQMMGSRVPVPSADADEKVWDEFYTKLGRPKAVEEYVFDDKLFEGVPEQLKPSEAELGRLKQVAFDLGLDPTRATKLLSGYLEQEKIGYAQFIEQENAKVEQAQNELKKEWGQEYDNRLVRVGALVKQYGDEDFVNAMASGEFAHQKSIVQFLDTVANLISEDVLKTGSSSPTGSGSGMTLLQYFENNPSHREAYMSADHPDHKFVSYQIGRQVYGEK